MIKTIMWDFAGVVLHTVHGTFNSLLAERLGAPISAVERVFNSPMNDRWDIDEIDDNTFYHYLLDELHLPHEKISIIQRFVVKDFYVDDDILAYIKSLREKYTSLLLTNFPAHIHDFMKTDWVVDGAFDHIIASCDVKHIKPNREIYRIAMQSANSSAEECVFIDDREINVRAAESLGIHGIHFKKKTQMIQELEHILSA